MAVFTAARKESIMIPGPYAIYAFTPDDSDGGIFHTLSWGYDTAADAFNALPQIAATNQAAEHDCVVLRLIDRDEAAQFTE